VKILYLALDPSPANVGAAWCERTEGKTRTATLTGIENLGRSPLILQLQALEPKRVLCVIERPAGIYRSSPAVRAAAVRAREAIRHAFPRRAKITFVDPKTWQAKLLRGVEAFTGIDSTTKDKSLWLARNEMGLDVDTDHEADAACLLRYALCFLWRAETHGT